MVRKQQRLDGDACAVAQRCVTIVLRFDDDLAGANGLAAHRNGVMQTALNGRRKILRAAGRRAQCAGEDNGNNAISFHAHTFGIFLDD